MCLNVFACPRILCWPPLESSRTRSLFSLLTYGLWYRYIAHSSHLSQTPLDEAAIRQQIKEEKAQEAQRPGAKRYI